MRTGKNVSKTIILIAAAAGVALITAVVLLVVSIAGRRAKKAENAGVDKGAAVLKIGDSTIYTNQFRFFASLVLNDETLGYSLLNDATIDRNATVKNAAAQFAKEYIYRRNDAKEADIELTDAERTEVLDSIDREYEKYKTSGDVTYEGEEYFAHYYGLTREQYVDFWLDWALIEKYDSVISGSADMSEDAQKAAYEKYADYLYGKDCTVLSLSLEGKDDGERKTTEQLAQELLERIQSGKNMEELVAQHCDDASLVANNGKITLTPSSKTLFPDVYEWVGSAAEGDIGIVTDEEAVYIIRIDSVSDFNSLVNTEKLKEWTALYATESHNEALLSSGKYTYTIYDGVYNQLDLTEQINSALNSWSSYFYSSEGFGE